MRHDLRRGLLDGLPFFPSIALLGAIFGAGAGAVGVTMAGAVTMSALVFSGTAQFAAMPLWQQPVPLVALSTLVLSLRFSLMTASLGPRLGDSPTWVRALLAFGITDENYALAVAHRGPLAPTYLFGTFLILYVPWVGGTALGGLVGERVPAAWAGPLGAIFPIVFLSLVVLVCTDWAAGAVALLAAALALLGKAWLPDGWYVVAAGLLASLVGPLLERWLRREARS